MRPGRAIVVAICAAALLFILLALIFLAILCNSCGYFNSGSMIHGPSTWYDYPAGNASYVALDVSCKTLGQNEVSIMRQNGSRNVTIETVHESLIITKFYGEQYGDTLRIGVSSSYGSDMYYGGARINVYLPEGPIYDIKVDSLKSKIRVSNFTGTNLVVYNRYGGDLYIDGGDYDYVYADNAGAISGQFLANKSTLKSGNGRVSVSTPKPG